MKLGLGYFYRTAKIILRKGKFTIPPLFNAPKVRLFSSNKRNWCDENFSNNSNLDVSDIYLPVFPCQKIRKLYMIPRTPKLVKKVIINFWFIKGIPVVVQKNCEPELL